jgi:uncharacterized Zn-finger protein
LHVILKLNADIKIITEQLLATTDKQLHANERDDEPMVDKQHASSVTESKSEFQGSLHQPIQSQSADVPADPIKVIPKTEPRTEAETETSDFEVILNQSTGENSPTKFEILEENNAILELKESNLPYCDICDKSFSDELKLKIHLRAHGPDAPYRCDLCPQMFPIMSKLKKHFEMMHDAQRKFRCSYCNMGFNRKEHVTFHERFHTDEKPYVCQFDSCNWKFVKKSDLYRHNQTHRGRKPFRCGYMGCKSKYTKLDDLINHKTIHQIIPS